MEKGRRMREEIDRERKNKEEERQRKKERRKRETRGEIERDSSILYCDHGAPQTLFLYVFH